MSRIGGAPKCPRCGQSVYFAEEAIAAGKKYHQQCLTCKDCNKRLDSTTMTERDSELYCKSCYSRKFGPRGFGYSGGGSSTVFSTHHSEKPQSGPINVPSNPVVTNIVYSDEFKTNTNVDASQGGQKFCANCGEKAQVGARFCVSCGSNV